MASRRSEHLSRRDSRSVVGHCDSVGKPPLASSRCWSRQSRRRKAGFGGPRPADAGAVGCLNIRCTLQGATRGSILEGAGSESSISLVKKKYHLFIDLEEIRMRVLIATLVLLSALMSAALAQQANSSQDQGNQKKPEAPARN